MNREDVIRMARESGGADITSHGWTSWVGTHSTEFLERFAALVAAEKEQQMIRDGYRQCAKGQRTTQFCGLLDAAVKAERERCCAIVYGMAGSDNVAQRTVEAIRARGET